MRRLTLRAGLFLSALLLSGVAFAQDGSGNDEVTLKNGGSLRGTVVSSEPGVSVKIIEMGEKNVRVIPWAQVTDVERGKYAPKALSVQPGSAGPGYAHGATTAGAAPVATPQVDLGAQGVVRLHIDSPIQVKVESRNIQYGSVGGYGVVMAQFTPICTSPCDKVIDGSRGDEYVASGDFPGAKVFNVGSMKGDVELKVTPGNKGLRALAITLDVVGGVAIITGGTLLLTGALVGSTDTFDASGNPTGTSGSSMTPIGGAILGAGAAALVGGIILGIKSGSVFDLHPTGGGSGTAAAAPRYWRGEF